MFSRAKQAEILRSSQKDEYYSSVIKSNLADILQTLGGPRFWLKWNKEFEVLADIVYFTLTTFGGYQTLGEEYVNIIMVNKTLRALPSKLQRGIMIVIQCCMPYILDKGLVHLEKAVDNDRIKGLTPKGKETLKHMIPVTRDLILVLHRCNLAWFYIKGIFYHVSKRLTNIQYILVRPDPNEQRISNYKILGWLCAVQLMWTFVQQLSILVRKLRQKSVQSSELHDITPYEETDISELELDGQLKCALCLEQRQNTTCTPCGHLFCWTCIHEWCRNKPMCPLCREEFHVSRLVCLKNYDSLR